MVDSCFVEFKLDRQSYSEKVAIGSDGIMELVTIAGEDAFIVNYYPPRCSQHGKKRSEFLRLGLLLLSKSKRTNPVFEAFVVDKDGAPSLSHANRATAAVFPGWTNEHWNFLYCWDWDHFLKPSDLESLWAANGGVVTIMCGFVVRRDNPITVPASGILGHLGGMMNCADGSDVAFSVAGETFHAHRAVLAARSPVFKAEIFGGMAEARMPCITVHDVEPATFKALLCFIYTDSFPTETSLVTLLMCFSIC